MTPQSIPACSECKHYFDDHGFWFPTCKFHYFEKPDYINGIIDKIELCCPDARESEKRCGHEGRNFEQRETPVVEEQMSFWQVLKAFLKDPSIF